jgi:hypothetical protein
MQLGGCDEQQQNEASRGKALPRDALQDRRQRKSNMKWCM